MPNLEELLAQQRDLTQKIEAIRREEKQRVLAEIRELMNQHGLTAADLVAAQVTAKKVGPRAGSPVAPKYRDQAGNTWSGRGLKPKWLTAAIADGKALEDFAV